MSGHADDVIDALWTSLRPRVEVLVTDMIRNAQPEPRRRGEFATAQEVADHFGKSPQYIYGLIRRGVLTRHPPGSNGPLRIRWSEIDDFDAGRPTGEEARRLAVRAVARRR